MRKYDPRLPRGPEQGGKGMSGRTPITPWSADTGVSGEPLAAAPAVQALQPLIDGASMASSPDLNRCSAPWPPRRAPCRTPRRTSRRR